ncbi:CRISPR-associated endonuclease Cas1, partial [Eubacterium aggregans]|uniref:CRISPR-associated endonuclease Cas1 n=1 Tax=Eubacterium aggregans TaxID=81409 RepID=UPI003F2F2053
MKKLLNTLYSASPGKYLALDGETIVIREEDAPDQHVPLHNLEGIVSMGYRG